MGFEGKTVASRAMYTPEQLNELEQYFKTVTLPAEIQLSQCEKIFDVPKFVKTQLNTLRSSEGAKVFTSYYDRLVKLKELLEKK